MEHLYIKSKNTGSVYCCGAGVVVITYYFLARCVFIHVETVGHNHLPLSSDCVLPSFSASSSVSTHRCKSVNQWTYWQPFPKVLLFFRHPKEQGNSPVFLPSKYASFRSKNFCIKKAPLLIQRIVFSLFSILSPLSISNYMKQQ